MKWRSQAKKPISRNSPSIELAKSFKDMLKHTKLVNGVLLFLSWGPSNVQSLQLVTKGYITNTRGTFKITYVGGKLLHQHWHMLHPFLQIAWQAA